MLHIVLCVFVYWKCKFRVAVNGRRGTHQLNIGRFVSENSEDSKNKKRRTKNEKMEKDCFIISKCMSYSVDFPRHTHTVISLQSSLVRSIFPFIAAACFLLLLFVFIFAFVFFLLSFVFPCCAFLWLHVKDVIDFVAHGVVRERLCGRRTSSEIKM